MSKKRDITITLTNLQVARVLRQATGTPGLITLLSGVSDLTEVRRALQPLLRDTKGSRSTLRALLVLAAFPADGSERELADIADTLDLTPSTTYRYVRTWMELELLEQDPTSRRYRRAVEVTKG